MSGKNDHDIPALIEAQSRKVLENFTHASYYGEAWRAEAYQLSAGQPLRIVHANKQRRRLLLSTDEANTVPVWISPATLTTGGNRSGAIPLAAGADPQVFKHAGDVYAVSSAACWIYVVEEYCA